MATQSDGKIIERESAKKGLADRYLTDKAGGAFDARSGVKTTGANEKSLGGSTFDTNYTNTKGFKIKMAQGQTEFKEVGSNGSLQSSLYMKGFNNKKYSNGSFSR
jgi:hypothetical protein